MDISYFLVFTTGFLGGFGHCIGMCGPLVISYTFYEGRFRGSRISLSPHLLYSAGRITTYVFIGSLMGLAGSFANTLGRFSGIQDIATIIAGCIMILMGFSITGILGGMNFIERHNSGVIKAIKMVLESESAWRYYPLGILMGFLPCGLSYSVFIASAGTADFLKGMVSAVCFGIGTVPAMLLFGIAVRKMSTAFREWMHKAGGITIIFMGLFFIYRSISGSA